MNPIVIAGGIIALLLLNRKSKAQTQMPQSIGPIPSPANPSGLDKPMGPSTTSDPITSPANPAGLDVPSESISSPANPDVLAKDVEPSGEYEVVSDGNWTPSPANPKGLQEELMLDTSTPVSSPANPKGLIDILISNEESKSGSSSSDRIASPKTTDLNQYNTDPTLKDPQTGLSLIGANISGKMVSKTADGGIMTIGFDENYPFLNKTEILQFRKLANSYGVGESIKVYNGSFGGTGYREFGGIGSFEGWLLEQTGFTRAQAGKGKLAAGPYSARIYLLGKQKGLLNVETIKKYIQYKDKTVAEYKEQLQKSKERPAKPKPKVFAGKVLDENGNYVTPKGQQDCPIGYNYLSNAGWSGCLGQERYEEMMMSLAKKSGTLPQDHSSKVVMLGGLFDRGVVTDKAYLTASSDKLVEMFRQRTYQCNNEWCNVLREAVLTDSTSSLSNKFQFKNTFYGTLDGKWVALHPMPISVSRKKRTKNLVYMVFPITKEDYDFFKERAKWYAMYLKTQSGK